MKKYQIQNTIGSGNFSTVYKGVFKSDGSPCAVKVMRTHHQIATRQILTLKKFKHPNIVSIIDFEQTSTESRIVLQYVGMNTLQLYQSNSQGLKQQQVKCILFQAALGLACVHSQGIIHRDIKPQNIMIDKKSAIIKLVDFGLAIDQGRCQTDYIATRWYRAPENLLGTKQYTCSIDVFSLGCVIVELYISSALFPGSNNIDQIYKIFTILGYPTAANWPKGYQKMLQMGIRPKNQKKRQIDLKTIMNPCDPRLVEIIEKMLQINPKKRITCTEILRHQYFKDIRTIIPPIVYQRFQQDIINNLRTLSFKSLYSVKSYKNLPTQKKFYKKNTKLNTKYIQPKQKQTTQLKTISSPQFLRQNHSCSLDTHKITKNSIEIPKFGVNKQKIKLIDSLQRKKSTPSLFVHHNTLLNRKKVPSIFRKQSKHKQQFLPGNHKNNDDVTKNYSQTIVEDSFSQMKDSKFTPNLSQATTTSKIFQNTSRQAQIKIYSAFAQTQNPKSKCYDVIPNVKMVSQIDDQVRNLKTTRNIPSKNFIYMSTPQLQILKNPSSYHIPQRAKHTKANLDFLDFSRGLSTNLGFQMNSATFQHPQNNQKKIQSSKTMNYEQLGSTKYLMREPNLLKSQEQKIKLQNLQSISIRQINKKPFHSPNHRYLGASPQSNLSKRKQNKLIVKNSIPNELTSPFRRQI